MLYENYDEEDSQDSQDSQEIENLKPVRVSRHRKEVLAAEPTNSISLMRWSGGNSYTSTGRADWVAAHAFENELIEKIDREKLGLPEPVAFCLADARAAVIRILGPQAEWFNTYLANRGKRPSTHTPNDHVRFGRLCAKLSEAGLYEKEE